MRGSGLSQREVADLSPAACISDIEAVVEAAQLTRFTLLGAASGGTRAIEYAARHPDHVSALVLYESFPSVLDAFPRELIDVLIALARTNWLTATRSLTDIATRTRDPEEQQRWMEVRRWRV
jgi:pimeloyl-ACP methyl ester carboxylesterase